MIEEYLNSPNFLKVSVPIEIVRKNVRKNDDVEVSWRSFPRHRGINVRAIGEFKK